MLRSTDSRLRSSTQMTASRDFRKEVDSNDTFKENEDSNRGLSCRLIESVRLGMGSSRQRSGDTEEGQTSQRQSNLECRQHFISPGDEYNHQEDDEPRRMAFAGHKAYSHSQDNLNNFFRHSVDNKVGRVIPTKVSFHKQEIIRHGNRNEQSRPSLQSRLRPNQPTTLKASSSNQDLKSFGSTRDLRESFQSNNMLESRNGPGVIECANKDGKKAKYRIVNSEQEEELFYCSKCSIMLLQQGFNVQLLESGWQDPNVNRTLKRKSQIQRLNNLTKELQKCLKSHAASLQDEKYFVAIEEERGRICQTYDYLTGMIEELKSLELQKLQTCKQNLISEVQKEKATLFGKFARLQTVRDELEEVSKMVSKIPETDYASVVNDCLQIIGEGENYEPLEMSINGESVQHKMQKLISQLTEYFSKARLEGVQFSFDRGSTSLEGEQFSEEKTRKPFRNLFTEDSARPKPRIIGRGYQAGESIQECYEDSFASNMSSKAG